MRIRNFIHKYCGWIDEAYLAEGREESIKAWRRIFGNDFAKGEEIKAAKSEAAGPALARSYLLESAAHLDELVDVVRNFGLGILPSWFYRPAHMRQPPWVQAQTISSDVQVIGTWHSGRYSVEERALRSGEVVPARGGIWFDVRVNGGQPVPSGFQVHWRVTNTGAVALARKAGRGDFYPPTVGHKRWEDLQYRGVHIAEALIVRMKDDVLVGQSPLFNVVIE